MSGRPDSYIPLYIGDYLADTTHLSTVEHGAYLLLLFHYWNKGGVASGGGLPDNDRALGNIVRLPAKQWLEISPTIREFFSPISVNGKPMLMQKRMEEVLEHVVGKYEKKCAALAAANAAKREAAERLANARADADEIGLQQDLKTKTKTKLSNEKPESSTPQADVPASKPKTVRGTRWPKEEKISAEWLDDAESRRSKNSLPRIDLRLESERFVNYWASKSGGQATKLDWHATWINWALNAKTPQGKGNGTGKPTAHDRHLAGIGMLISGEDDDEFSRHN